MIFFTKQERSVIAFLCIVCFMGVSYRYLVKRHPQVSSLINVIDGDDIYYRLDVNAVSEEELVRVPYIGPATARAIIQYREGQGTIRDLEEIKRLQRIPPKNFEIFSRHLKVR